MKKNHKKDLNIKLNKDTKIIYNQITNKDNEINKYKIKYKNNETIISFCKSETDYNISVQFKDIDKDLVEENELLLVNTKYQNESIPAYKYIKLKLFDENTNENEGYIDLNEEDILNEIIFIICYTNHFNNHDIQKAIEIITPMIKELIEDFINFNKKSHTMKLVP